MTGLTDDEWSGCSIDADNKVCIRWRLDHLTNMFTEPRSSAWLGCTPSDRPSRAGAESGAQIGSAAGQFGEATRHSFVLHIADELIHPLAGAGTRARAMTPARHTNLEMGVWMLACVRLRPSVLAEAVPRRSWPI
jgi:hypothetical protein